MGSGKRYAKLSIFFALVAFAFYSGLILSSGTALAIIPDGCDPDYGSCSGFYPDDPTCGSACPGANCQWQGVCGPSCRDAYDCVGTWCPDGVCNGGETCSSCPGDCGTCDPCAPGQPGYNDCSSRAGQPASSWTCRPNNPNCQVARRIYTGACTPTGGSSYTCDQDWEHGDNCCTLPKVCSGSNSCGQVCSGGACVAGSSCTACGSDGYTCTGNTIIFHDRGCSGGGNCFDNPTTVENCDLRDGWYDSSGIYNCCYQGNATTCKDQQFRDYRCQSGQGTCPFSVTNTRTIPMAPGTFCGTPEDFCVSGSVLRNYTGSSCSAGTCGDPFVDVTCQFGCVVQSGNDICQTNPPPVVQPITYTGTCNSGETITLNCVASDANQQANTLSVKVWAGTCNSANCFATRSWTFYNNEPMTAPPSGGTFTKTLFIDPVIAPPNTGIPATCRATDDFASQSNWGDAYPLCVTNSCPSPPSITFNSVVPNPAKAGTVTASFNTSRVLQPNPAVYATIGSRNATASFVSLNGLTYTYTFSVLGSDTNGPANVIATGLGQSDSCYGSGVSALTVDTVAPNSGVLCNGAACQAYYLSSAPLNLTFTCADATSGCSITRYTWNGGPLTDYTAPVQVQTTGNHTFEYFSIDNAGNSGIRKNVSVEFASQIGCDKVVCVVPPDECSDPNTLKKYTSAVCIDRICVNNYNNIVCEFGCVEVPGAPDFCASNPRPNLTDILVSTNFQNFARQGDIVSVRSIGFDPTDETIRLICGTTRGANDLCTSAPVTADPICTFASPWSDSANHPVHCFLKDASNITSVNVLSASVISDNTVPQAALTKIPNNSTIVPNTIVNLLAFAGDDESGLRNLSIYVNGQMREFCTTSLCTVTFTPSYGLYNFTAVVFDNVANSISSTDTFAVNNLPNIEGAMDYTGSCLTGGRITVWCNAVDPEDPSSSLSVRGSVGDCTALNCYDTRAWVKGTGTIYINNSPMNFQSGKTFNRTIRITSVIGTGIAGTCRATDTLGGQNMPAEQGDAYPICVVSGCVDPPTVISSSVNPLTARQSTVDINFTVDRTVHTYNVTVTPNGMAEIPATLMQNVGNRTFGYRFLVQESYADGPARVKIRVRVNGPPVCPQEKIIMFTIDKTPAGITFICNGEQCDPTGRKVYRAPVQLGFICSDPSGCTSINYGINAPPTVQYSPTSPPIILGTGDYAVNVQTVDGTGNIGTRSQRVRTYNSTIEEEARIAVRFDRTSVISGSKLYGFVYCFLRDSRNKELRTRDCEIDPGTFTITHIKNSGERKNYFDRIDPPITPQQFLAQNKIRPQPPLEFVIDGHYYTIDQFWKFEIPTSIFASEFCINGTDNESGIGGGECSGYSTSSSEVQLEIKYPDVIAGTLPLTSDGRNAPNFTKLMPIKFAAEAFLVGLFSASECKSANCRVEFNFVPYDEWDFNPPRIAQWSGFDDAYTPEIIDVASSGFNCNEYKTLYVRATKQSEPDSGINTTNQSDFFVNCNTKVTIVPVEKRLAVGETPGKIFDLTIWNPTAAFRTFDLAAATTNPNGYPLSWINFNCAGATGCAASDDTATLSVEGLSSKTIQVECL